MDKEILKIIHETLRERFRPFPKGMAAAMYGQIEKICFRGYKEEIPLLPARTLSALRKEDAALAAQIGMVHCLGWTSYYLFDCCADERSGEIALAIALYRLMICEYRECFGALGEKVLEGNLRSMDAANHAEEESRKGGAGNDPPPFGALARKSRGHALAVLAPMIRSGYGPESREFETASTMMDHIIIARQLSDDMRDWQEDFDAGSVTRVNFPLFDAGKESGRQARFEASMRDACVDILRHAHAGARLAQANPAFKDPEFFIRLAKNISGPAKEFLRKRRIP
jgi:hypothetical protein